MRSSGLNAISLFKPSAGEIDSDSTVFRDDANLNIFCRDSRKQGFGALSGKAMAMVQVSTNFWLSSSE